MKRVLIIVLLVVSHNAYSERCEKEAIGFIKINPHNRRYFCDEAGRTWIPTEINVPAFTVDRGNEQSSFRRIDSLFQVMNANGINAVRLWGPGPFFEIETGIGVYDTSRFKRIDYLLSAAKKYGLRVKFSLENSRNFSDYRSADRFNRFYRKLYHTRDGGPLTSFSEYIDSAQGQQLYFNRAKTYMQRYKDNPTIYCWELWNEINTISEGDWFQFTKQMLQRLKPYCPSQLITQSLGSLDGNKAEKDYIKYATLDDNDIFEIHRYLDSASSNPICHEAPYVFLNDAVQFGLQYAEKSPIVINETGAVEAHHTGDSKLYPIDKQGVLLHDILFSSFFSGAAGPASMWHFWSYIEKNNLWWVYKGFEQELCDIDPVAEALVPKKIDGNGFECYGLVGPATAYLWIRQNAQTHNDLVKINETEKQIEISTKEIYGSRKSKAILIIDPWTHIQVSQTSDKISYDFFSQSVIVRLR